MNNAATEVDGKLSKGARVAKRLDPHRPGAVIPAHYIHVLSYSLPTSDGGWPTPSLGVNCELDYRDEKSGKNGQHHGSGMCCVIGLREVARVRFAQTGGTGKCSICGAQYVYGDVWVHEPTGEHIHVGHDCARKYSMMADRSEWELENGRMRAAMAVQIERARKKEARDAFLSKHCGLEAALVTNHPIVKDIAERFRSNCELSEKQVALVLKLSMEASRPKAEERCIPAPEGRQTVHGKLISFKSQEGGYGIEYKMTVKVTATDGATWLAWGTCPAVFMDRTGGAHSLRGLEVQFDATLKRGREPHFALFSRPTKAAVVKNAGYMRAMAHRRLASVA